MPVLTPVLPLWQALLFAMLGGLILNLMPCVFPILAMKAVGLARLAGEDRGQIRANAASYSAGVVLSFLAIGAALLGLRLAGSAAGWGFQFTSPVFVLAIAWLMLAVGLNLSGVFALGGPIGAGGHLTARGGFLGSFATGALAVGDDMIHSVAGGGILSRISRRFGEGVVNGALTARVGVAAMDVCRPLPFRALPRPKTTNLVSRGLAGLFADDRDN
jgi:thiol:disulfide interchange protein DsbD